MTAEEFEIGYATRSKLTLEQYREYYAVRPCDCGEKDCHGWQTMSLRRAKEYDEATEDEKRYV